MESFSNELSFVLLPLMAPGHAIPMVDMAKVLAKRGVTVTVLLTALNAVRFEAAIERAAASGLGIRLRRLRFPSEAAGLPEGCESFEALPSFALVKNFFNAIDMLQDLVQKILEDIFPKPSCIVCDKNIHWMSDTADRFKIPRIVFDGMSCFAQQSIRNLYILKSRDEIPETESFLIPNIPDEIKISRSQLPGAFNPTGSMDIYEVREKIKQSETKAYGFIINTFEELEHNYVEEFRKVKGGKVWCVGPLSLFNEDTIDKAQRGNNNNNIGLSIGDDKDNDQENCMMKWLDSKEPRSVVYACLGSLAWSTLNQFIELALGLEASNHPFILVTKAGEKHSEAERWISENEFEERVGERCLLIRGWAPQVLILSHPSVGAFLTHCGWNSTLEGITAGVPLITWPLFAEQFLNEKFVVNVLRIGVSVGSDSAVHLVEEGKKSKHNVGRDDVRRAIQRVMDRGQEGNFIRENARKFGEMANKAVQVGGSSHLNVTHLIQEITKISTKS